MNEYLVALKIGLLAALAVGPLSILCIRKTIQIGFWGGISVGLGVACTDFIYSIIAVTSGFIIFEVLTSYSYLLKISGGIFLMYIAYKESKVKFDLSSKNIAHRKFQWDLWLLLFITSFTSPMTILVFLTYYIDLGKLSMDVISSTGSVLLVFLGSFIWWLALSWLIDRVKKNIPDLILENFQRISIVVLILFASGLLFSGLSHILNYILLA